MTIVVDTNIVFSGLLNPKSRIGELIIKSKNYFEFHSVDQMKLELEEHKGKILKIAGFSMDEYIESRDILTSKIIFHKDIEIPKNCLGESEDLLKDIDCDEVVFLALSQHLNSRLWTGDKKLISGLRRKGVYTPITLQEMMEIYRRKELSGDE